MAISSSDSSWSESLPSVEELLRQVGQFIKGQRNQVGAQDIHHKSLNSLVSFVDQEAEKQLVAGLRAIVPEASFLTEEATVAARKSRYQWIVDPLDGTTNYLHGLAPYAISIALMKEDTCVLGVVYELSLQEMFTALPGQGAKCNGRPIQVSPEKKLQQALFATGFPYHATDRDEQFGALLTHLFRHTRGLRRMGSAATDLAYVADGRFSGFFEYGLSPWDVAAGALLVQEAGGRVSDFRGGEDYLHGKEICAGSDALHEALRSLIAEYLEPPTSPEK